MDLVSTTEKIEVPFDLHRFIIGKKGKNIQAMMDMYDVKIAIPHQRAHSDIITIKGPPANVEKTKQALKERIEQLEFEKQDKLLNNFKLIFEVDPQYRPKIIGRNGTRITKIREENNVQIKIHEQGSPNEKIITITGLKRNAEAAKIAILKLVLNKVDINKEEVSIDSRIHSRLIGRKGRSVKKLMETFNVHISFPEPSDPDPDLVVIYGAEDDALDAKDHLLNLEEAYLLKMKKDSLYTQPFSHFDTQLEDYKEEIKIDSQILALIIGDKTETFQNAMEELNVDISYPTTSDADFSLVVICGAEKNVLDAKNHLLDLEDYFQDMKEKNFQYEQSTNYEDTVLDNLNKKEVYIDSCNLSSITVNKDKNLQEAMTDFNLDLNFTKPNDSDADFKQTCATEKVFNFEEDYKETKDDYECSLGGETVSNCQKKFSNSPKEAEKVNCLSEEDKRMLYFLTEAKTKDFKTLFLQANRCFKKK